MNTKRLEFRSKYRHNQDASQMQSFSAAGVFHAPLSQFLRAILIRVPREEQMMSAMFASEYTACMQRIGRFLPKL